MGAEAINPRPSRSVNNGGARRIRGVEPRDQLARERRVAAALGKPEESPRALAEPLDQPGLGQKLQMARNPRLRLPQNVGEVRHRQLGLGQERQNTQPRRLARSLERPVERGERQLSRRRHGLTSRQFI